MKKPRPLNKAQQKMVMENLEFAVNWGSKNSNFGREQLMSICFLALSRAVRKFDPNHPRAVKFQSFCKPYIRGELRREWKRFRVVKHAEVFSLDDETREPLGKPLDVPVVPTIDFEAIDAREMKPLLSKCLKVLTPYERQVIRMRFFDNMKFPEIGDKMGFCRQAIHITYCRALRKIRQYLDRIGRLNRDA